MEIKSKKGKNKYQEKLEEKDMEEEEIWKKER